VQAMLKHDLSKDGSNPNSKMRSSPLKPLFMLINMMAGLLAICVFRQAEQWLLIVLGVYFTLLSSLYVAFFIYLFRNNRDELR
jgi:hypothetical protein